MLMGARPSWGLCIGGRAVLERRAAVWACFVVGRWVVEEVMGLSLR